MVCALSPDCAARREPTTLQGHVCRCPIGSPRHHRRANFAITLQCANGTSARCSYVKQNPLFADEYSAVDRKSDGTTRRRLLVHDDRVRTSSADPYVAGATVIEAGNQPLALSLELGFLGSIVTLADIGDGLRQAARSVEMGYRAQSNDRVTRQYAEKRESEGKSLEDKDRHWGITEPVLRVHYGSPFEIVVAVPGLLDIPFLVGLIYVLKQVWGLDLELRTRREILRTEHLEAKGRATAAEYRLNEPLAPSIVSDVEALRAETRGQWRGTQAVLFDWEHEQ
jgi:hypothetical protein